MRHARLNRRAWLQLLLAGGAGFAAAWSPFRLVAAACSPERQPYAAALSQGLFDGEVFPCLKDWLAYDPSHCTADRLHAGVDFGAPDGRPVKAITSGVALNVKIGLGAVTVLTDDFRYGCGVNHGVTIIYFHLQNIQIKIGERVEIGAYLGDVMNIGGPEGTPYLHLEVRKGLQVEPTGCDTCTEPTGCSSCEGSTNTADITLDPLAYLS
jgi:murein DD-endopeptidase MepM/ murein hydrolase activator NlpD